jgi:hypothetical protein
MQKEWHTATKPLKKKKKKKIRPAYKGNVSTCAQSEERLIKR